MWFITTITAAIIVTIVWHIKPKIYKLDLLSLMLWGTSIMIFVDHILGYEGGAFIEIETDGIITNGALLGIIMLIPIILLWGIIMITKKQKIKLTGE